MGSSVMVEVDALLTSRVGYVSPTSSLALFFYLEMILSLTFLSTLNDNSDWLPLASPFDIIHLVYIIGLKIGGPELLKRFPNALWWWPFSMEFFK